MNLKHYVKCAGCITAISCIVLLSTTFPNNSGKVSTPAANSIKGDYFAEGLTNDNGAENKKNRIIIKPSENNNSSERNTTDNGNGTRVSVPSTNNNLKVRPLPPADANAQIIVNLLK